MFALVKLPAIFDNVRVPKENVIGNVGEGFKQAMKVLDGGRISIASLSCGVARGAYEASVQYAKRAVWKTYWKVFKRLLSN